MDFNLKKTLWAVMLAMGEPIHPKKFQEFIHRSYPDRFLALGELKLAVEELNVELAAREAPERIAEAPEGYYLRLTPDYAQAVRGYRGEPKPQKLSAAALETLSIVAYRQPITRAQIEAIRGVACDGPVGKLLELELIEARPNDDLPGRPMVYTTTNKFLNQCGVKDLGELPQSDASENEKLREFFKKADAAPTAPTTEVAAPADVAQAIAEANA